MHLPAFVRIFNLQSLLLSMAAASAALLAVALIGQYGFDLHPCHLCIAQRIPYGAIVLIGSIAAQFIKNPKTRRTAAWLCVLLFLTDAGIAFYHAGVELGWFPGPSGCTNTGTHDQTIEEMRRALMNAPLVPCDQPMLVVLGLSMAAWNCIAAIILTIGSGMMLRKIKP